MAKADRPGTTPQPQRRSHLRARRAMGKVARPERKKDKAIFRQNAGHGVTINLVSFDVARMGVRARMEFAAQDERLSPDELLARARFRQCLLVLNGDCSPKALLTRMRALLSLGEHHAVARPIFIDAVEALPTLERATAKALLSVAYFRSGLRDAAAAAMRDAYALAGNDPEALCEIRYHDAMQRWADGNLNAANACISHLLADPNWRAKGVLLRSWVRQKAGDYAGQLNDLKLAYHGLRDRDVWARASILGAAAALARELYDEPTAKFVEAAARDLEWSSDTAEQEFYTFRYLAWCAALGGRSLAAFDHLARAESSIPSLAHAVLVHADRATIAMYATEVDTARQHLDAAVAAAEQADWVNAGEARTALLLIAELLVSHEPKSATKWLDRYNAIRTPIPPKVAFAANDRRLEALEDYVSGVVMAAKGQVESAAAALRRAYTIWSAAAYWWRAAMAAAHLGRIDKHAEFRERARELIVTHVPNAFFARALAPRPSLIEHSDVVALSPTRRDVLALFIAGLNNKEIAARLGFQEQTVKNNLRYIYRAFGAKSDRDLNRILRERGII